MVVLLAEVLGERLGLGGPVAGEGTLLRGKQLGVEESTVRQQPQVIKSVLQITQHLHGQGLRCTLHLVHIVLADAGFSPGVLALYVEPVRFLEQSRTESDPTPCPAEFPQKRLVFEHLHKQAGVQKLGRWGMAAFR